MLNISSGPAVCRICHSSEKSGPITGEPLISPCECKGTMGLFHRGCLERWLLTSNTQNCEICKYKFQTYSSFPGLLKYLSNSDARTERKNLMTDLVLFICLTPLTLGCSFLCVKAAMHSEAIFDQQEISGTLRIEFNIVLMILTILLIATYFIWLGITISFHSKVFKAWQRLNKILKVRVNSVAEDHVWDGENEVKYKAKRGEVILSVNKLIRTQESAFPSTGEFIPITSESSPDASHHPALPTGIIQVPDSFTSESVARSFTCTSTPNNYLKSNRYYNVL